MTTEITRRVIYHGRVQNVGFRATARQIAQGLAVAGFVRNLADGTVELVAQGASDEVGRFLTALGERMAALIQRTDETELAPDASLQGFTIR